MSTNTPNLGLRIIEPDTDGNLNVNVETDFSNNWRAIDAKLGAQIAVTPGATPLDFTYGIQALTMPRTAQFHMNGITGRTAINRIGRAGRTGTNANAANLDVAKTYVVINEDGANVTVDGASQAVPYKFTGKATAALVWATGKVAVYELPAADLTLTGPQLAAKYTYVDDMKPITNPWAIAYGENSYAPFTEWALHANASATAPYKLTHVSTAAAAQDTTFISPAVGGQAYTFNRVGADAKVILQELDAAGNILVNVNGGNPVASGFTWVMGASTKQIKTIYRVDAVGTFVLDSPMLNLGATAKAFVPRKDQMIVIPTQLASNVAGTVADQLYRLGSEYWVDRHFRTMDLDGSLPWVYDGDYAGYKGIRLPLTGQLLNSGVVAKYDGKILQMLANAAPMTAADQQILTASLLYLTIADTNSGWGEGYNPTPDEIKAYFYGWKMYDNSATVTNPYPGTGTKAWVRIDKIPNANGFTTGILPTASYPEWTPYKVQYQLAVPVQEQIIPEGEITLIEGLNQVETGVGMIVRERAPFAVHIGGVYYRTNLVSHSDYIGSSSLKNRVKKILRMFKGIAEDKKWIRTTDLTTDYGSEGAYYNAPDFDPTSAYTVTYLAEAGITASFDTIQGEYAANLKTGVDRMARNQAEIATRVSVLETQKVNKVQPQWINAPLLAGWLPNLGIGIRYRKNDENKLELRIAITGGTTTRSTVFAMLPYKPMTTIPLGAVNYDSGANNSTGIVVSFTPGGELRIDTTPGTGLVSLASITLVAVVSLD